MDNAQLEYFQIPTNCPVCNSQTEKEGQFLYCRSKSCPSKLSGSIQNWVEKLGLLHWGDSLIFSLTSPDNPSVSSIADLYRLSVEEISKHCSGMKVAKKCYDQLHAQKRIPLQLVLSALNIQFLGIVTATDMVASGIDTIDKILEINVERLTKVPNIGERTAQLIHDGIQQKKETLVDLNSIIEIVGSDSGPLSGKSFCITGALSRPRKAVEKMIMDSGGTVKGSVGLGLSYLITNFSDTTSTKMQKAKSNGTQVINENDLYVMLGNI